MKVWIIIFPSKSISLFKNVFDGIGKSVETPFLEKNLDIPASSHRKLSLSKKFFLAASSTHPNLEN
jgi:hypothetical protein